ncbi:Annexin D8 [Dionaea muscipula]
MATLVAPENASPIDDAAVIKKACLGFGTDEKALISVLAHRNASQLKQIRQAYEDIYNEDLIKQLKSELSGDFERAICHWVLDPRDREAIFVHEALKKATAVPDHYKVILEIACTKSPEELLAVKRAYHQRYKHSLEEDIASCTTGKTRNFLVAMVSTYRYPGDEINEIIAHSEAKDVHTEIHDGDSKHEEIIRIISTRSKLQLMATFNHFKDIHGTTITKVLRGDDKNELFAMVRVAIRCMKNPQKYFAKVLRKAIRGPGTDEDALTRVIVTRAEVDLQKIKELYKERNNISLEQAVAGDTSGDYKAFLLALLGFETIHNS